MRELTMEEIDFVSGGDAGDATVGGAIAGGAGGFALGGVPGAIIGGIGGAIIGFGLYEGAIYLDHQIHS